MKKRIVTRIGNVFCVEIDEKEKCFFQYVANDMTMLNSSVIRVFKRRYPMEYKPNIDEIVNDEVLFYAHTILRAGIMYNAWYKVGTSKCLGDTENIMFRFFWDFGSGRPMTKSYDWHIWKINTPFVKIGEMRKEYLHCEIGCVLAYDDIVARIKTGRYKLVLAAVE